MDEKKINIDENLTEKDVIVHIDESPLEHIIETLPVPAENIDISNEDDIEEERIERKLTKIFMAIKNEKEETKELAVLLKKYVDQQGDLSSDEMII